MNWRITFFVIFLSVSCTSQSLTNAEYHEEKYVAAESGLILREGPGKNFNKVTLMPVNSKVVIEEKSSNIETISDKRGAWVRVEWIDSKQNKKYNGWCFDGYLASKPVFRESDLIFDGDPAANLQFKKPFSNNNSREVVRQALDDDYISGSSESYWEEIVFLPDNQFVYMLKSIHSFDRGETFRDTLVFHGSYEVIDRVIRLKYDKYRRTSYSSSTYEGPYLDAHSLSLKNYPNLLRFTETDEKCYLRSSNGRIYVLDKKKDFKYYSWD